MKRVRRSAAIGVALLSFVASACGSSSPTPTTSLSSPSGTSSPSAAEQAAAAYVAGFCKAFTDYLKQAPQSPLGSGSDLQKLKRFYISFFAGEISATHDLVTKIQALGTPAVPGGAQVSGALIKAFIGLESDSRSLREEAGSLPTSSPPAFNKAVNRLFGQFKQDSKSTASGNPFQSDPQLLAAFRSSPECAPGASPVSSAASSALSSAPSISSPNG